MKLDRVFDIIDFQCQHHAAQALFRFQEHGIWHDWSPAALQKDVQAFAHGLLEQGVRAQDRILIIPKTCHPMALCLDLAAQMIGALPVIVHSTFTAEQMRQVIDEVAPRFIFCAASEHLDSVLQHVSSSQGSPTGLADQIFHLSCDRTARIFAQFHQTDGQAQNLLDAAQKIEGGEVSNIIYTSGSSGRPKGVMLTHQNIMSNLGALTPLIPIAPGSEVMSYLPYSHILERAAIFAYLMMGMKVHVIDDVHQLSAALREVRPTFMTAVPRIIERMAESFERFRRQRGWWRKKALNVLIGVARRPLTPGRWQLHLRLVHWLARHFFFRKFRMALGGRLTSMVVGGAHLRPALTRLFAVAGIALREGYGMTETAPIITLNQFKPGLHKTGQREKCICRLRF